MTVDFSKLGGSEVHVRILNAFQPEAEGPFYASYSIEDSEGEDSYGFLFEIDFEDPSRHRIVHQGPGVILDHATLSPERHLLLEMLRHVRVVGATGSEGRIDVETPHFLNRIWKGGREVYLTGDAQSVFRSTGDDFAPLFGGGQGMMRCLHATNGGHFVAGGDHGLLVTSRGDSIDRIEIPIGFTISAVLRASDETTYIGCEGGLAFAIRDDELLPIGAVGSDIISLCEFDGRIFFGTVSDGILVLDGETLVPFSPIAFAYALNVEPHAMIAVTEEAAFVFDGKMWRGFAMVWERAPRILEFDVSPLNG